MESIYNPTTPGRRGMSKRDFSVITTKKPLKSLTVIKTRGSGRNNQGHHYQVQLLFSLAYSQCMDLF